MKILKNKKGIISVLIIATIILLSTTVLAITEVDNGIMAVYIRKRGHTKGLELGEDAKGFDVKGYIETDETTNSKKLISSTFKDWGYHVYLNVNGANGEMSGKLQNATEEKLKAMQYTAYDSSNEWQTIDGISMRVSTQFINNGEQLKIIYQLKNTTSATATFSLATTSDVQIDGDDKATIHRLEDKSGIQLWTDKGKTGKPVQFILYAKDIEEVTDVDTLWLGYWNQGNYFINMFYENSEQDKIEGYDSAMAFSWTNKTIDSGETQTYSVLMEVGEINVPNTGITLDNNTKFYYTDVKINGTVIDKDLKDNITIHYTVDGTEYTLPAMATTGTVKDFQLDLTSLNLEAGTEHNLKVWATDSLGFESNVEERKFTVTYLKNPELSISNEEWTKDEVTFRIIDTKNTDFVKNYQYRINNGEWTNCSKDTDIPITESGIVTVDVRIEGSESNDYSDVISKQAKIDSLAPIITFERANGKTAINVTDTGAGIDKIQYVWSTSSEAPTAGEFKTYSSAVIYDGTSKGKIYLWAKAIDKAGNETIESTSYSSIKKPEINSEDEFINKYITFKLNSSNEDTDIMYQFKINDGEWTDISANSNHTITNIKDGEVKISARVLDNAGRYSEISNKTVKVSITGQVNNDENKNNQENNIENISGNKDDTTAIGKLPKAGMNNIGICIIAIILIKLVNILYKKMNKYKDIK